MASVDVLDIIGTIYILKYGMVPTHSKIVEHDVIVRAPTQGYMIPVKRNFTDDDTIQRYDQLCHFSFLVHTVTQESFLIVCSFAEITVAAMIEKPLLKYFLFVALIRIFLI